MTIAEAMAARLCADCIFRLVGPGQFYCLGPVVGAECPGKVASEKRKEN